MCIAKSPWPTRLRRPASLSRLGTANIAVGVAPGIYTGILLSSLGARPLWASAALGPLFLVSGLSTGAAFAHMVARDPAEQSTLLRADNAFLMVELALIALFLIGLLTAGAVHSNAAALLLGGDPERARTLGGTFADDRAVDASDALAGLAGTP